MNFLITAEIDRKRAKRIAAQKKGNRITDVYLLYTEFVYTKTTLCSFVLDISVKPSCSVA